MADIDFGQLSEALNDKSDRDLRNVDTTAKADAVIDYQEPTADNGYTWYRKYASGWVEQGGISTEQNVSLPIEMANVNYAIQLTGICSTSNNNVFLHGFRDVTTTGFITQCNVLNNSGGSAQSNTAEKRWQVSGLSAN